MRLPVYTCHQNVINASEFSPEILHNWNHHIEIPSLPQDIEIQIFQRKQSLGAPE